MEVFEPLGMWTGSFDSFDRFLDVAEWSAGKSIRELEAIASGYGKTMKSRRRAQNSAIKKRALGLMADPQFLFNAGQKIGELGVVGEVRNRLILLLAGIARSLPDPPSVLVKGSTSSGKSTLVKDSIQLFPPDCILERAGLSGKALAYGRGSLANKILVINEYRCGRDAQLLLRLLQSEGQIKHEATTVRGVGRSTQTVERVGMPAVLTTTTDEKVFSDDETRFLSVWVDESPKQTLAIVRAQASVPKSVDFRELRAWRTALSFLTCRKGDFRHPPEWLRYVAEHLPLGKIRVRRDWNRFLSFLRAVALCRSTPFPIEPLDITFSDYCVAYEILEPVLASTLRGLPTQELLVSKAVATVGKHLQRAVTIREVAKHLRWKRSLVYKHLKAAVRHRLVKYEAGTRERNVKRVLACDEVATGFLPSPRLVLKNNRGIGRKVKYVDPFSGLRKTLER
jgi:hypothetical protein